jgi:hypothetical protein
VPGREEPIAGESSERVGDRDEDALLALRDAESEAPEIWPDELDVVEI